MRKFKVNGPCIHTEDYMVDITDNLNKITEMVKARLYFVINRPRQYGKSTTLGYLKRMLKDEYVVISISFGGLEDESFETSQNFCLSFMKLVRESLEFTNVSDEYKKAWFNKDVNDFTELSIHITRMCKDRPVVLMIDEVDQTSNNRIFLKFLSKLRDKYIARVFGDDYTFHSVILAGVYDIKNIKQKLINEGYYVPQTTEGKRHNSPWNIAANFDIDMSFNPKGIESMLKEYQNETNILIDTELISNEIYKYTSGYPFLVSYICKLIDEKLDRDWSLESILKAVKIVITDKGTLSDDLIKNLETYKELYTLLYSILINGKKIIFDTHDPNIDLGNMFGYIKMGNVNSMTIVTNRIFETIMTNYFITRDSIASSFDEKIADTLYNNIVKNNLFDMELCLCRFSDHYREIYNEFDAPFFEKHGRLLFITYLKPLINGKGFYHLESQFTDYRRMDLVVDYLQEQFIIELKIWDGEKIKENAYEQLLGYMNTKNATIGYLLIFDFRKNKDKLQRTEWIQIGDKKIFSIVV